MSRAGLKNVTLPSNFSIPTFPAVARRIGELLEDPNIGVGDIAAVVSEDAPLSAKVLKIANSAFYGMRERCMSTQQAATVLGLRTLRSVVMQASVMRQFEHLAGSGFDIDALWKRSITTAQSCTFLARRCKRKLELGPDQLYVCGLLHDLGQVVLLDNLKERYIEIVKQAEMQGHPLHVVEAKSLGYDHTDVGHSVALRWDLPPIVASAIQAHHGPQAAIVSDPILSLAARTDMLVHDVESGKHGTANIVFDARAQTQLGVTEVDVEALAEFIQQSLLAVEV